MPEQCAGCREILQGRAHHGDRAKCQSCGMQYNLIWDEEGNFLKAAPVVDQYTRIDRGGNVFSPGHA